MWDNKSNSFFFFLIKKYQIKSFIIKLLVRNTQKKTNKYGSHAFLMSLFTDGKLQTCENDNNYVVFLLRCWCLQNHECFHSPCIRGSCWFYRWQWWWEKFYIWGKKKVHCHLTARLRATKKVPALTEKCLRFHIYLIKTSCILFVSI